MKECRLLRLSIGRPLWRHTDWFLATASGYGAALLLSLPEVVLTERAWAVFSAVIVQAVPCRNVKLYSV